MKGISLVRGGTIYLLSPFEDAIISMDWFNIGVFDVPCEDHQFFFKCVLHFNKINLSKKQFSLFVICL
jgi:hypothetical protein